MPQKKNPDMAELTRGKTGRLYGNLVSVLTTLKALPSSYNRDLQEDKEALFDSVDTVSSALKVFSVMLPKMKINRDRMREAAGDPNLLATDLAEYLVGKGMPFRQAHETVGRVVSHAITGKKPLDEIQLAALRKFSTRFDSDVKKVFDVGRSLSARRAVGAPSPGNVKAQIKRWRKQLRG
jgi:argininosuccinate lyase